MATLKFKRQLAISSWKYAALNLLIFLLITNADGQDVMLLNYENPMNIRALNENRLQVGWKHLISMGNIDLIEEIELKQKVGKEWKSLMKVKPNEALIIDNLSICKAHEKITVSITPKFGKECIPYCSSTFSDYTPIQYFENKISPYSCIKNSTMFFIQLNDNMVRNDIFSKCIKNVKIYEDGELSKFRGKITFSDSNNIYIKLDHPVRFYDLVYEIIDTNKDKTSTIRVKRLNVNLEQKCETPGEEMQITKDLSILTKILITIIFVVAVILLILMVKLYCTVNQKESCIPNTISEGEAKKIKDCSNSAIKTSSQTEDPESVKFLPCG